MKKVLKWTNGNLVLFKHRSYLRKCLRIRHSTHRLAIWRAFQTMNAKMQMCRHKYAYKCDATIACFNKLSNAMGKKQNTHTHTSTLIWTRREQNEERNEEHTCNGTHRRDNVEMETKSRRQILISLITCRSRYQNRMCLCKSVKSKSQDKSNQDSQSFQLESRTIINSYRKTSTNPMDC